MNKLPKFYLGQKVVVVQDHSQGIIKKGEKFTVTGIRNVCCGWRVTVGLRAGERLPRFNGYYRCNQCNKRMYVGGQESLFCESLFAPIQDDFEAITFSKVLEEKLHSVN
jgi:hypothetical protein